MGGTNDYFCSGITGLSADKPAWLDHTGRPQRRMKVGCCGMAGQEVMATFI